MVRLDFPTTNNEVEYEAIVEGLDLAKAAGAMSVVIYYDSQVITNQVNGDYKCKGERMKRYLDQVKRRVDDLKAKIIQILKGENEQAGCLAKAALVEHMITHGNVLSFVQLSPLIDSSDVQEIGSESNWTTTIASYLKDGILPDEKEAGVVLLSPKGDMVECMVHLDFPTTNNEAEYKALVAGLDLAKAAGATSVVIYCDSQVVTNQVNGDYKCKGERMKRYLD